MAENVLLLRESSRSADGGADPYEQAFHQAALHALSIPVLETTFTNLTELKNLIRAGPGDELSGVIITSVRSSEAWEVCVKDLNVEDPERVASAVWTDIPFYVVGKKSAAPLLRLSGSPFAPDPVNIRGDSSGTAENLAHFILQDLAKRQPGPLSYLTGDKNRETLPDILRAGGISLRPLQAYKTEGSPRFEQNLKEMLDKLAPKQRQLAWWIVYFAPSAAEFSTPLLRSFFDLGRDRTESFKTLLSSRIASIGPTTTTFLQDQLGLTVEVTSPKPNAESLVQAIVEKIRERAVT